MVPSSQSDPPTPSSSVHDPIVEPSLHGKGRPIGPGLAGIVAALVQTPADLLGEANRPGRRPVLRLAALSMGAMILVGLVVASFSGGAQMFVVPLKLCVGLTLCALLCLPSLYVFSSVAGAGQSVRETGLALAMGVSLIGVLLVALAPVTWLFSQSTDAPGVMGALHIMALLVSAAVGVRLISKVMRALNGRAIAGVRAWGLMFVLVMLQMTTTLRPLIGEFDGLWHTDRVFFLEHWARASTPVTRR
ncbi:MAG: hypothetical protein KUG77_06120 [Nannocystaceae bacterium]|nr:hypothetical protein [Nannocystaceae bacterium]